MTRVVFMGTPAFAVPSLQALIDGPWQVVGVFCQPDRPKGRSKKPQPCPVKQCAVAHDIPVFQPQRIRKRVWRQQLETLAPDLVVVAAYGQILSQRILDVPPLGCLNVHASLLPRWRGAAPIHAAIAAGDAETGVGLMKMTLGLDEGPVYRSASVSLAPSLGKSALETQLAHLGAELLSQTLPHLRETEPVPQNPEQVTYAPIIQKAMGVCDFQHQDADNIARLVRAFEEWPNMLCQFRGNPVKILAAKVSEAQMSLPAGHIAPLGKKRLVVGCANDSLLEILLLQPAGKKPMEPHAFLNGYRPSEGESFEVAGASETRIPFP